MPRPFLELGSASWPNFAWRFLLESKKVQYASRVFLFCFGSSRGVHDMRQKGHGEGLERRFLTRPVLDGVMREEV